MLAVLYSRASVGLQAPLVTVETHISGGLPGFTIVGLPETVVKESKDRVRSALLNSKFDFPTSRITVNLAPADLPKEGGRFDLPIALGILAASKQIPVKELILYEFMGELALSGELRSIQGTLPIALGARKANRILIVPHCNAEEATLPHDNIVYAAKHLLEIVEHLKKKKLLLPYNHTTIRNAANDVNFHSASGDLADITGQPHAKRALEIAAAGGHNLLMIGPPGTGKTMLATRLPSILPPLSLEETLEVMAIYSLSESQVKPAWKERPFRAPHHTASAVALVGGRSNPKPGEISLAHHGILFLDELPEFDREVLEVLREPLEKGTILISRAARQVEFPAKFQLIAAMNPCPCGHIGNPKKSCQCTAEQVKRYRNKISGPLLDRIDMHIEMPPIPTEFFLKENKKLHAEESSEMIRQRVIDAMTKQQQRLKKLNSQLNLADIKQYCAIDNPTEKFLHDCINKLALSTRSYHRILRVARTIADLAGDENISGNHVKEAISYRKVNAFAYNPSPSTVDF